MPPRPDGTTLVYLHGNDQFVTASASAPGGYVPDWAPRDVAPLAVGPKYAFQELPALVLVPEIGTPQKSRTSWSVTAAGALARTDRDPLARLVADVRERLGGLGIDPGPPPGRVVVAAHSGGGRGVAALLASPSVRAGPTDLWLLDATYGWGTPTAWAGLAAAWAEVRRQGGWRSRVVVAWIDGTATDAHARAILDAGRAAGLEVPVATWPEIGQAIAGDATLVGVAIPYGTLSHDALPGVLVPAFLGSAAR